MPRRFILILGLLALVLGCSRSEGPELDARTQQILAAAQQVSSVQLYRHVAEFSAIHSRYMHWDPGTAQAIHWLLDTLAAQGTPAVTDSFTFHRIRDIDTANVQLTFPGHGRPEEFILVGAHWDSVDYPESFYDSSARAPGVIDNATGVAALIELARVLADRPLERSVRLVFFAGEEIGMFGSRRVRDYWRQPPGNDSLVCMINVDMLGYDPDWPDISLVCDTLSAPLAAAALPWSRLLWNDARIDTLLRTTASPGGSSDHLQFWYYGLPAFWLHEGPGDPFPHANSDADSLANLQVDFLADGTRALVGAVMHLAGPLLP